MTLIRTLLVDDSPEFLEAAGRFLSSDAHIQIVGLSLSGQQAIEQVNELNPDLVLIDLGMPGISGLETTQRIKSLSRAPRVIILTLHDNPEYRAASLAVQADGFVPKSEFGVQLLPLIHTLFEKDGIPNTVAL